MFTRRELVLGFVAGAVVRPAMAAPTRRVALLVGAPWAAETWLDNGVSKMREALHARGFTATEVITSTQPMDRNRFMGLLENVQRRIASWRDGDIFLYYDGHGMYSRAAAQPQAGLQLNGNRQDPGSHLLWREVWAGLGVPTGVRVLAVPDCCHTNLLAGRLPDNVSALIMKSEPQNTLACRTGGAMFGEGTARKRFGIISYYTSATLAAASTVRGWLSGIEAASERDISSGRLAPSRRPRLMLEGDRDRRIPGEPRLRPSAF